MEELIPNSLYVLAGICIQGSFTFILNGIRKPIKKQNIVFSIIAIVIALSAISRAHVLQAINIPEYIEYLRINVSISLLIFILIPIFSSIYSKLISYPYIISVFLIITFFDIYNIFSPFGITYTSISTLNSYTLPWGEKIVHGIGQHSLLFYVAVVILILIMLITLYQLFYVYNNTKKNENLYIAISFLSFFVLACVGIAIRLSLMHYFYPGVFSFIAIILGMSYSLDESNKAEVFKSETKLRSVVDESPIGIALLKNNILIDVNRALMNMHGIKDLDKSINISMINSIKYNLTYIINNNNNLKNGYTIDTYSINNTGLKFPILVSIKEIDIDDENLFVIFVHDQTKIKDSEKQIKYLSEYDSLTKLPNKTKLINHIRYSGISENNIWNSLLVIDLNNFSILNDSKGHSFGDELLENVAQIISNITDPEDMAARVAGDKYAVFIKSISDHYEEAKKIALKRAREYLNELDRIFILSEYEYYNSARIGLFVFNSDESNISNIFSKAELAMYQAKNDNDHIVLYNHDMQNNVDNRISIEAELRKAISDNGLQLNYQIQVDNNHQVIGVEALIRLDEYRYKYNMPFYFIPIAEKTGLISKLGMWVIKTACKQLNIWKNDELMKNIPISINISSIEFKSDDFIDSLLSELDNNRIHPSKLKIELTESMFIDQIDTMKYRMDALKDIGVKLSLDDFGTAYSSLQYLRTLPIDELKIDQSFIRDIVNGHNDKIIVSSVVAMANALNIDVIAEGVENAAQKNILESLGCARYQGYLFGKPENSDGVRKTIAAFNNSKFNVIH